MLDRMSNRNLVAVSALAVVVAGVVALWAVGHCAQVEHENERMRAASAKAAAIQAKMADVGGPAAAPAIDNRVAAEPEPLEVDVYKIVRDNEVNPVAAENAWVGKRIRISGTAHEVRSLDDKQSVLVLKTGDDLLYAAICIVDRGSAALIDPRSKDRITVSGHVRRISRDCITVERCRFEK